MAMKIVRPVPQGKVAPGLLNAISAAAEPLSRRLEMGSGNIGEAWQEEAKSLFYRVPELRTAGRITGRAMSQCRLICARVAANGEPVPLNIGTRENPGPDANNPAVKLLQKFAGGAGGQAAFLDQAGVLFTTTGEGIAVGKLDPTQASPLDDFDRMQLYSPGQVVSRNRSITVRMDAGSRSDRVVSEEEGYVAIRIWRPDPFRSWEADSAAKANLGVLREISLYDDRIRATSISRLAGPGIMFVNEDITLPVSLAKDEPGNDASFLDPFMLFLMEIMSLAMKDQNSAAARVPILVRARDPKAAAELLTFDSPFDDKILELRQAALNRFAVGVDIPAEILSGIGDVTHWTGALITSDWKQTYLPELMGLVCGSLTSGWLLPALANAGYGDQPNDVIIWYDDSSVRTRENVGPEAQAAYDRGEITGDTFRRALGYDDGDAPDFTTEEGKKQLALMLVLKNPALLPGLADLLGIEYTPETINVGGESPRIENLKKTIPTEPGNKAEPVIRSTPITTTQPNFQ